MAREKRTNLPTPTADDIANRPEMLRRTSKGDGWAWKCEYCGRFASSVTLAGKYVCHMHGGVTAEQRSPVAKAEAVAEGRPAPRPPGRPLVTGTYSKQASVRIDQLVREYQERQLDPDTTDEDMLYLRAYLDEAKEMRKDIEPLRLLLEKVTDELADFRSLIVPDENVSVDKLIDMLERGREVTDLTRQLNTLLKQTTSYTKDLEGRHKALIIMAKTRAETRLKDAAARQLDVFTLMVRRFMVVLSEQLTVSDFEALQKRIEADLSEIPESAITGAGSVEA